MKWLFFISFLVITFAFADEEFKSKFKFQNKDTLTFEDLKYDTIINKYKFNDLDDKLRKTVSDKFVNRLLIEYSLYSAHCYSFQNEKFNFNLFSLFITQDDSDLLYLVTTNKQFKLIDYYEIGEQKSEEPRDNNHYSTGTTSKAIKTNDSTYKILNYKWNEKYYHDGTTDTLNEKIETSYIKIDSKGMFRKVK